MKISVALCTYNGERHLREQLDSIAAQTRPPDEIVICDDRSTDGTLEVIEAFTAASEVAVRAYFNEENLGSTRNFEKAIRLCDGDIVFLSDQDDVWLPQKVERFVSVFESRPDVGLVFSDALLNYEDLRPTHLRLWQMTFRKKDRARVRRGDTLGALLVQNFVTGAAMAFRTRYRDAALPVPEGTDMIHDGWISLMIAMRAEVVMIDEPLLKYRQHGGQQLGVLLPKLNVPIRQRHKDFIGNRRLALRRLQMLRDAVAKGELGDGLKFTGTELLEKIEAARREVEGQIEHFTARGDLPGIRALRLLPVLRELGTGRYHRHSKGLTSAALDLLSK